VLLCISNLAELKGSTIPKIVNLFENAFELSFTENLKVSLPPLPPPPPCLLAYSVSPELLDF